MAVDFAGFATMVDALGGVEVCSTTPLEDYELGTVLANAGRQIVDGHTALKYVRARQVTTETNGDYGRIKRQQLFLSSLLRSLISKDTFFSLSKLNNVVNMFINDSYVDNIGTKDLVDLGQSVQGVERGPHHLRHGARPAGYTDEYGNEAPRTDDMRALFDAIINDDPLPEEKNADNTPVRPRRRRPPPARRPRPSTPTASWSTPSPPTPATSPCGCPTPPARTAWPRPRPANCSSTGSTSTTPDDYPGPLDSTTVFFSPGNEQAAATVASSFTNGRPSSGCPGMGDVDPGRARLRLQLGQRRRRRADRRCRSTSCTTAAASAQPSPRGPDGHQRRRHHLRMTPSTIAAGGIHLSFTLVVVTIAMPRP